MATHADLTNGKIPRVGFGTWKVPNDVCAETVYMAIKNGYRHIDEALIYANEKECGQGIKKANSHTHIHTQTWEGPQGRTNQGSCQTQVHHSLAQGT